LWKTNGGNKNWFGFIIEIGGKIMIIFFAPDEQPVYRKDK